MDVTTLKISLAGLMHDIGKLTDQGFLGVTRDYIDRNVGQYCPFYNGRHSHKHALYTAAFVDHHQDILPPELNEPGWGDGEAFINLAAGHHNPEKPDQWIIAMADRLSSGFDRRSFEDYNQQIPVRDYQKTRLSALFEQLNPEQNEGVRASAYCYPLERLSPLSIFPQKRSAQGLDLQTARQQYLDLCDAFVADLGLLRHRLEDISLWVEHFESLLMVYASAVPSARAGNVKPDVSLYDHAKSTAALAAALHLYHRQTDTYSIDQIRADEPEKFLLISGDFYGIQDYIFSSHGDTRRYRSKLLRGRSFMVSLFTELAADLLCRKLGLSPLSVLLTAAGKFTIMAPNTPAAKKAVQEGGAEINDWLFKVSYGRNSLGLALQGASPRDFGQGYFHLLWDRLRTKTADKKFKRMDLDRCGVISDYLDQMYQEKADPPLCPLCGHRPSTRQAGSSYYIQGESHHAICPSCRDQVFLGTNLVKKHCLAVFKAEAVQGKSEENLFEPIFGRYQLQFADPEKKDFTPADGLIRYWRLGEKLDTASKFDLTVKYINGYVPVFTQEDEHDPRYLHGRSDAGIEENIEGIEVGAPKKFGHIAAWALNQTDTDKYVGVQALGVLKADVDNLGLLMACGLRDSDLTLSRLATLSRQLNNFFTVYLPHLLKTEPAFQNIYTVFAGGDDLFLIGPWNAIIQVLRRLKIDFEEYVCHNPQIHFSAGITMHKPNTPVDAMARQAEEMLEISKQEPKNQLTIFRTTIPCEELSALDDVKGTMNDWVEREWINKSMLYRLNQIIPMSKKESRLLASKRPFTVEEMACTKWRSILAYSTERNVGKTVNKDERPAVINEVRRNLADWITRYHEKLNLPLWEILYNTRR